VCADIAATAANIAGAAFAVAVVDDVANAAAAPSTVTDVGVVIAAFVATASVVVACYYCLRVRDVCALKLRGTN
jgi:hypothetical protein